jgi:hypothetical protein
MQLTPEFQLTTNFNYISLILLPVLLPTLHILVYNITIAVDEM